MDTPTLVYFWQGHILIEDGQQFEMAGVEITQVRSAYPINHPYFISEHRNQPTCYGWVPATELEPVNVGDLQQYRNWQDAKREAARLETEGPLPETFAAFEVEDQLFVGFHANILQQIEVSA